MVAKSIHKDTLRIVGARENNLKNVTVSLPKFAITVVTGLSGSGKSSLAFDVLHAEGQRRFLEGMSSYARNMLDIGSKPDVDAIEGLSPTIAIDQKSVGRSPRSTVGTLSEISDYLRALFVAGGTVHCAKCKQILKKNTVRDMALESVQRFPRERVTFIGWYDGDRDRVWLWMDTLFKRGHRHIIIDGKNREIREVLAEEKEHTPKRVGLLLGPVRIENKRSCFEQVMSVFESAFSDGGECVEVRSEKESIVYQRRYYCQDCRLTMPDFGAKHFSFNHPEGACEKCSGLGECTVMDPNAVISSERLSIDEGALGSLGRFLGRPGSKNGFHVSLDRFARKEHIDLRLAIRDLTKHQRELLLYGREKNSSYEGIIPFLERKYRQSPSEQMRKEMEKHTKNAPCDLCAGKRLRHESLFVLINGKDIAYYLSLPLDDLEEVGKSLEKAPELKVCRELISALLVRTQVLKEVGLEYLSCDRTTLTLSGGEAQRIRLAVQLVSELSGVTYILDEPSVGLHPRDTQELVTTLERLRDAGNTVVVVEHDRDIMRSAQWVIDVGPGAGEEGGEILYAGDIASSEQSSSLTAQYLFGRKKYPRKAQRKIGKERLVVRGAKEHNLRNITVSIPLGIMNVVTGVSGSGKSTFVHTILSRALKRHFFKARLLPGLYDQIDGLEYLDKVITMTQSPIGRTSRSNVATYTGVFSHIREVFAQTEGAQSRGYSSARFSFNLKGGRCEACHGEGVQKIEMFLLPDRYAECEVCCATRYAKETLDVRFKGQSIADVLDMSVSYARVFFGNHPHIEEKLEVLERVGLGYLRLGQGAPDLSGGEAQRIKLATELARKSTGNTLYILDEPTVGLHFEDVRKLLGVLDDLVDRGNTVLMVEHNTDVIRRADYIIDFGPGGGASGGRIVTSGTVEKVKHSTKSVTGRFL